MKKTNKKKITLADYIKAIKSADREIEKEIFALKQKYPNWNIRKDLNRLNAIYQLLVEFESKQ